MSNNELHLDKGKQQIRIYKTKFVPLWAFFKP